MDEQIVFFGNKIINVLEANELRGITLTSDEVSDLLDYIAELHKEIIKINTVYGDKMLEDAQQRTVDLLKATLLGE